jgi:glycosyltransferase involved in cell wall biosynthesis
MISIIGTVGVPACYGGFETLVENLLDESENIDLTVYCSSKHYSTKATQYKNAKLHYIGLNANGVQSIPYDVISLCHAAFVNKSTHILVLGVSGAIALPILRLFSKATIVTNIDGLEWKRDKWGWWARKFLKLSERIAVKFSNAIIADNQAIADYVVTEYAVKPNVIAYGGDHAVFGDFSTSNDSYALALCRIEPENNVDMILEGFSKTDRRLKFIGNWDNSEFGRRMRTRFEHYDNIELIDPIYDPATLFELRDKCDLYVHGHSAGGTNPSLVEMMHFSKTICAYDCNYNRASTENGAYFFSSSSELEQLLEHKKDDVVALKMREIADRRYTWKIVKKQYFELLR